MAVSVLISADASATLAALKQIQDALQKTNQTGVAFSKIDYSHPEIKKLEADLRKITQQFQDLTRISRGATASAVRASVGNGSSDIFSWLNQVGKIFPSPQAQQRHIAQVGAYVLNNTQFQPQPPHQPQVGGSAGWAPPGGGGGGGGQGAGQGGQGGAAAGLAGSSAAPPPDGSAQLVRTGYEGGGAMRHEFAPLRVVIEDKQGRTRNVEVLPIAQVGAPRAYGT